MKTLLEGVVIAEQIVAVAPSGLNGDIRTEPTHCLGECLGKAGFSGAADPLQNVQFAHGQARHEQPDVFQAKAQFRTSCIAAITSLLGNGDTMLKVSAKGLEIWNIMNSSFQFMGTEFLDPVFPACTLHPCHLREWAVYCISSSQIVNLLSQVSEVQTQNFYLPLERCFLPFQIFFFADTHTVHAELMICFGMASLEFREFLIQVTELPAKLLILVIQFLKGVVPVMLSVHFILKSVQIIQYRARGAPIQLSAEFLEIIQRAFSLFPTITKVIVALL